MYSIRLYFSVILRRIDNAVKTQWRLLTWWHHTSRVLYPNPHRSATRPGIKKSPILSHEPREAAAAAVGVIISRDLASSRPPGRAEVTSSTTTTPLSPTSGTKVPSERRTPHANPDCSTVSVRDRSPWTRTPTPAPLGVQRQLAGHWSRETDHRQQPSRRVASHADTFVLSHQLRFSVHTRSEVDFVYRRDTSETSERTHVRRCTSHNWSAIYFSLTAGHILYGGCCHRIHLTFLSSTELFYVNAEYWITEPLSSQWFAVSATWITSCL